MATVCVQSPVKQPRPSPTLVSPVKSPGSLLPKSANVSHASCTTLSTRRLWTAALTADSLLREAEDDSPLRPRLERLRQLTRGALAEMRTLVLELRPAELSEAPLHELLEGLVTALESRKALQVTVDVAPVEFDAGTRLAFYRVAQEALGNVAKHAQATMVKLSLTSGADVQLRIAGQRQRVRPVLGARRSPWSHHHARARRRRRRQARHQLVTGSWHRRPAVGRRGMTRQRTHSRRRRRRSRPASRGRHCLSLRIRESRGRR